MPRVVFLQCHPDPSRERLCHALGRAYCEGAKSSGHTVDVFDLSTLDYPVLRTTNDWKTGPEGTPVTLQRVQKAIIDCNHIAMVFPLWFGSLPAYSQAAFEQVFRPGVAVDFGGKLPKPLLRGKSARILLTMNTPALIYRAYFRQPAITTIRRQLLGFSGVKPVKSTVFGSVNTARDARVTKWLRTARRIGASDA